MSDLEVMEFFGTDDEDDIAVLCVVELLLLGGSGVSCMAFNADDALVPLAHRSGVLLLPIAPFVDFSFFFLSEEEPLLHTSRALNPSSPTLVSPADEARCNTPRRNGVLDLDGSFFP